SGSIKVFGHKPSSENAPVPGSGVGYMPQNVCLYDDLTIEETLAYFASLYGMKPCESSARSHFLINFLNLPSGNYFVGYLSVVVKRSVDLVTAFIRKLPLLILDEVEPIFGILNQVINHFGIFLFIAHSRGRPTAAQVHLGSFDGD